MTSVEPVRVPDPLTVSIVEPYRNVAVGIVRLPPLAVPSMVYTDPMLVRESMISDDVVAPVDIIIVSAFPPGPVPMTP
jgi:hypothetical protein